jgi:hypothetical protein
MDTARTFGGLTGLSLYINIESIKRILPSMTDRGSRMSARFPITPTKLFKKKQGQESFEERTRERTFVR